VIRSRRGTSLPEALIGAAIFLLVVLVLGALVRSGGRGAQRSLSSTDSVRAVSLAIEVIRQDLSRMCAGVTTQELELATDGRAFAFPMSVPTDGDPWMVQDVRVVHTIVPGDGNTFQLVRTDPDGARAVPGCVLADLRAQIVEAPSSGGGTLALSVQVVGADGFTLTALWPVGAAPAETP